MALLRVDAPLGEQFLYVAVGDDPVAQPKATATIVVGVADAIGATAIGAQPAERVLLEALARQGVTGDAVVRASFRLSFHQARQPRDIPIVPKRYPSRAGRGRQVLVGPRS